MRISILLHSYLAVAATVLSLTAAEADPLAVATDIVFVEEGKKKKVDNPFDSAYADNPFDSAYAELPYSTEKSTESLINKIMLSHEKAGRALKNKHSKNQPTPTPPTTCATGALSIDEVYELLLSTERTLKEDTSKYADATIEPRFLGCAVAITSAVALCGVACPIGLAKCIIGGKVTLGAACVGALASCGAGCTNAIIAANDKC